MKKKFTATILISILLVIFFTGCVEKEKENNNEVDEIFENDQVILNATSGDVLVIIPKSMEVADFNITINLSIQIKNIANESKLIKPKMYTIPTESIVCEFESDDAQYFYIVEHYDIMNPWDLETFALEPNESFSFEIEIPLNEVRNITSENYLFIDNPSTSKLKIILRLIMDIKASNDLQLTRKA